ncbi:hypothetical protein EIN_198140 [Entamoeba invadens IP1]|uniref:Uncharacterized protein n=1 Tax=Entamoeba invadens IP1 TaxID=370355 RepID=A0A0A1TZB8_ENTIV|nr:hypothetical protein EIN_198140 [Entamoeba invadens IP1]ELP83861.1 hypothetical protein EIN_198140 [Entamoeba invadens IP1]|eukprot:XP_004183207.1 hypothetical protein EIN_198140 [Entamoeba invadens IP1]
MKQRRKPRTFEAVLRQDSIFRFVNDLKCKEMFDQMARCSIAFTEETVKAYCMDNNKEFDGGTFLNDIFKMTISKRTIQPKILLDENITRTKQYHMDLHRELIGVEHSFIFAVEEIGYQIMKEDISVYNQDALANRALYVGRESKQSNTCACFSADGTFLPFLFCTTDQTQHISERLKDSVYMKTKDGLYFSKEDFCEWFLDVLIPSIERKKRLNKYTGNTLILMSAFYVEYFQNKKVLQEMLIKEGVRILSFPIGYYEEMLPNNLVMEELENFLNKCTRQAGVTDFMVKLSIEDIVTFFIQNAAMVKEDFVRYITEYNEKVVKNDVSVTRIKKSEEDIPNLVMYNDIQDNVRLELDETRNQMNDRKNEESGVEARPPSFDVISECSKKKSSSIVLLQKINNEASKLWFVCDCIGSADGGGADVIVGMTGGYEMLKVLLIVEKKLEWMSKLLGDSVIIVETCDRDKAIEKWVTEAVYPKAEEVLSQFREKNVIFTIPETRYTLFKNIESRMLERNIEICKVDKIIENVLPTSVLKRQLEEYCVLCGGDMNDSKSLVLVLECIKNLKRDVIHSMFLDGWSIWNGVIGDEFDDKTFIEWLNNQFLLSKTSFDEITINISNNSNGITTFNVKSLGKVQKRLMKMVLNTTPFLFCKTIDEQINFVTQQYPALASMFLQIVCETL